MLKKILIAGGCLMGAMASTGCSESGGPQWRLAVMSYTFNRFTLIEAIDKTRQVGAGYLETFSWQKVSPDRGNMQFNADMPAAAMDEVKQKLKDGKVKLTGYYFHELGKDEPATRKVFEFCRKMGMEYIVSEPDEKVLPLVDRLAQEYKVKVAIHNHPKDPKKPDYANWDPDGVMKMIDGCSKWIGCCADNGHWGRSGLDSTECIRKYQDRLLTMHLKDLNKLDPGAHDVPYGTGVIDLKGMLAEVKRQGCPVVFAIEYEHNMENNVDDVAQCVKYFNMVKDELGVK
ncbi:MAG: sugar phosphate isomerase/epimerase [Planctomycetes bacterium]|nr:sugar phosphate isomerase/epimerase [Planctomycetota bacterium]